jgi:hypothetical protein
MENRVMFLLIAIILIFAMFSKQGVALIKNLIGVAQGAATTVATSEGTMTDGTNTATDTKTPISGGKISSGILMG